MKLAPDNKGLIAAAIALNIGVPVSVVVEICNAQNKAEEIKITRNTLMDTLKKYTDVKVLSTLRRNTGSKDAESAWAKARAVFAEQLLQQI